MDPRIAIGLAAGFGGVAPNVFRLASGLMGGAGLPELSYVIGMLLFAGMGAAVALAFEERELKKAFFLGLGLPAMFQSGVNDLSKAANGAWILETPAIHASMSEQPGVPIGFRPADMPPYEVVFSSPSGKRKEMISVEYPQKGGEFESPPWATTFVVMAADAVSSSEKLAHERERVWYLLEFRRATWSGLKQSVGIKGVSEFEVLVTRDREK